MKRTFILSFLVLFITTSLMSVLAGSVPDTGQTQSYTNTFGEDSDYLINPPSYTKLSDNGTELPDNATSWVMVRDNVTSLIWEVKTDDGSIHDKDKKYDWYDAKDGVMARHNSDNFGSYSDWRLPTVKELTFIVNRGTTSPAINTVYFPNTPSYSYWSTTQRTGYSAWAVFFGNGIVGFAFKPDPLHVRAVRGAPSSQDFIDNGDGTVTDTSTGFMWQQDGTTQASWPGGLNYCENLTLAGHDDWRLPNINELLSLVDYGRVNPAINTTYFPNTLHGDYEIYLTSTSSIDGRGFCFVFFREGASQYAYKSGTSLVRAVRGGMCPVDSDCDDGVFCNGSEQCDAGGCRPGTHPCPLGEICDEATDTCSVCGPLGDSDFDGICDDGDFSGVLGDNHCTGGNTVFCDDNCPLYCNSDQFDADNDTIGDVCDATPGCGGCGEECEQECSTTLDTDGDGVVDAEDNCPNNCNEQQLDADGDGIGDVCDRDPGCGGCGSFCETEC